jgi:excisionase family DNA binding protein
MNVPRLSAQQTDESGVAQVKTKPRKSSRVFLTVDEVCELLNISRSTFYAWRKKGNAPVCRRLPNDEIRIELDEYDRWLDNLEEAA